MKGGRICEIISGHGCGKENEEVINLLLWYGFLGVVSSEGETQYIYSVRYQMARLQALVRKLGLENTRFRVNPAFWGALGIKDSRSS